MGFLNDVELGIGTWAWGDRSVWKFGQGYRAEDLKGAFDASLDAGIRLFDTAEVYGDGRSESYLGEFLKASPHKNIKVATKFMPFPWKVSTRHLLKSLRDSLR